MEVLSVAMSVVEARVELGILEAAVLEASELDAKVLLTNAGLPQEVVQRLPELWNVTARIGGRVVQIGKLIATHIIGFVRANPNLAMGLALGAALSALVAMVPGLGPFLAPLVAAVTVLLGVAAGSALDDGVRSQSETLQIAQDIIGVARKFFALLAGILLTLWSELGPTLSTAPA